MKNSFDTKTPPNDIEVEKSLISALLIDNSGFVVCDNLGPEEFYSIAHQKIYRAMLSLKAQGEPVDLVTLASYLKTVGDLEKVGGAEYLAGISDAAPIALNPGSYAEIITGYSIRRQILSLGQQISSRAFSRARDVDELIDFVQCESMRLQKSKRMDQIHWVQDLSGEYLRQILADQKEPKAKGYMLGFPEIDRLTYIYGPTLIIIAGRPSMGKTAFALTCMSNLARQSVCTGFLSIEMGKQKIMNRWLSMQTSISSMRFNSYQGLKEPDIDAVIEASDNMSRWPIMIDDSGSVTISDVERKCRKMVRDGAKLIFIDQLSKIRGKTGDPTKDYTANCNRISDLKKELDIPIFLLAQINRGVEQKADKRPALSDLKNTGALEEDGDIVILIHRPEYYIKPVDDITIQKKKSMRSYAEIEIAKNRDGACFLEANIRFDHGRSMFYQDGMYDH